MHLGAYDSTNNNIVLAYKDAGNSAFGTSIIGSVSGTSISFGVPVIFNSARTDFISTIYDSTNDKVVVAYKDFGDSNKKGTAIVGTIIGTSISFGTSAKTNTGPDYSPYYRCSFFIRVAKILISNYYLIICGIVYC